MNRVLIRNISCIVTCDEVIDGRLCGIDEKSLADAANKKYREYPDRL